MTSVLPFHNAWGQKPAYPLHHRKPEVLSFFFFAQKTLLFQHNKLAMAANVGDTNHETDKLELYPLISNRNVSHLPLVKVFKVVC